MTHLTAEQASHLDSLLGIMSRSEKLAQLQITFAMTPDDCADLARAGIGALFWPLNAAATNAVQRVAVEQTRCRIPLLIGLDVIHGHRTIFPIPLAQACSFDPDVAVADGRVSAREAASAGVNWTFAPMVDVTRDARWGRVCEGYGEDSLVNGIFGAAKVRGFQGAALSGPGSIAACAKHFVAYGAAEAGRDYNGVDISERRLREVYLPPFKRVVDAGVATVMASFNTVNSRPMHANRALLDGTLKREWGFDGVVVGDADGVRNLIPHGVSADMGHARRSSFTAGLDVEMGMGIDLAELTDHLGPDELDDARLDDAVRRVLELKFALGLFEDPYVSEEDEILTPPADHLRAARWAATRSAVLLKNDGTLPLPTGPLKVLLVGPYADSADHLGAWVQHVGSPASSLAEALREARPDVDLTVLPGASIYEPASHLQRQVTDAAPGHDIIIVAVGEPSDLSGEASSRADLRLPGDQEALIHAVAASGVPFAVVLAGGRPLVIADWVERAPALLAVWHLGTEAAPAIADLLTGTANPAGRLAMSFPRSVGQLPTSYDAENTGRPATRGGQFTPKNSDVALDGPANVQDFYTSKYRDLELGPEFPFGHGLSYSSFEHGEATIGPQSITPAELRAGARVSVRLEITNASDRDGDEVILALLHDVVASLAPAGRRLSAFTRVAIPAGATQPVELTFGFDELAMWGDSGGWLVEPGTFDVHIGPTTKITQTLTLEVRKDSST